MANSMHSVDTEIYQRSVEVFRNKRNSLPPEHLKDLAAEVVQRLVAMRKNVEPAIEHDADAQHQAFAVGQRAFGREAAVLARGGRAGKAEDGRLL